MDKMRPKIAETISDNFKEPAIQEIVKERAQLATETTLKPIIKNEVNRQVGDAVRSEQETIKASLDIAPHDPVKEMEPLVRERADSAVKLIVGQQISPALKSLTATATVSLAFLGAQTATQQPSIESSCCKMT